MTDALSRLGSDRRFEFESAAPGCGEHTFAVVQLEGEEAISQPYRFEMVLVSDDAGLDLDAVLAAAARLRILAPVANGRTVAEPEPYHGMLAEFEQMEQLGAYTFYRAVLVPRLWALSQYRSSEVYLHEQRITDTLESVLRDEARFSAGHDYELRTTQDYRARSYVCQYQESPLDFMARWMEREGIYYHFEQIDAAPGERMGYERLVLLDARHAQPSRGRAVNYRPADELDTGLSADSVQSFVCRTRRLPRALVLQDFNHRRAGLPLVARAEVSAQGLGEEMIYGENFRSPEEGERYARIRAEELRCQGQVFSGHATAMGLRSGRFMDLSHHYREDFDGRYLVTRVTHEGSQAGALLAGLKTPYNQREGRTHYRSSFEALREQMQFRPARTTPRPRVAGTMTATIDAEGTGQYAELDEFGQYKVQVPFDRTEKAAAKGSARIRMASPYAGSDHGMHFPLHKGAEVLLSFSDGDPDQPVIMAAVPNSANPSVVQEATNELSALTTAGRNHIVMRDTKGKEVIWLGSPFHDSAVGIGSVHPEGGGSIFAVTKGGKDDVSFGHANSLSFGSKNSMSAGTENSLGASFSNKLALGASMQINISNDAKWNMNLLPFTDAVRTKFPKLALNSLTIDDSDSLKYTTKMSEVAVDGVSLSGGSVSLSTIKAEVDTRMKWLRGLMLTWTGINLAQSAAAGMALNNNAFHIPLLSHWGELNRKHLKDHTNTSDDESNASTVPGWPGYVAKFGLDAVVNTAGMVVFQAAGKSLAQKLKELKKQGMVSKIELDRGGIRQEVEWVAGLEPPAQRTVRSVLTLSPRNGVQLHALQSDKFSGVKGSARIELKSEFIDLVASKANFVRGPRVRLLTSRGGASLDLDGAGGSAQLSAGGSSVKLDRAGFGVASSSVSIGWAQVGPNPAIAVLEAQLALLEAALLEAEDVRDDAKAAEDVAKEVDTLVWEAAEAKLAVAEAAVLAAADAVRNLKEQLEQAQAVRDTPVLNGLRVTQQTTEMRQGAAQVEASNQGVKLSMGGATWQVGAQGLSGDGILIKLG